MKSQKTNSKTIEFKKRKKPKKIRTAFFSTRTLCLLGVPLILCLSFQIQLETQGKIKELEEAKQQTLEYKQSLERERDYLAEQIKLLNDPEYLSAYAKKKLMYSLEDEILFIFPE